MPAGRITKFALLTGMLCALLAVSGCPIRMSKLNFTPLGPETISATSAASSLQPEDRQRVLDAVKLRNDTVEKDQEWIKRAYTGLMVKKLNSVPPKDYASFAKYLDNGSAYIVIHPAFYPFFHTLKRLTPRISNVQTAKELPKLNVVEKFLAFTPRDEEMAVLQAQERRTRDFLEFKSTQGKLMIIVVPKNFNKYNGYVYRQGPDEYMRYLNEVTNGSDSVVFIESKNPNRGFATEEDGVLLMDFLAAIQAKNIYVSGGYVGRCLDDFYMSLTAAYGSKTIFVVPELSDVSPQELNNQIAYEMLDDTGGIRPDIMKSIIEQDFFGIGQVMPQMKSLYVPLPASAATTY